MNIIHSYEWKLILKPSRQTHHDGFNFFSFLKLNIDILILLNKEVWKVGFLYYINQENYIKPILIKFCGYMKSNSHKRQIWRSSGVSFTKKNILTCISKTDKKFWYYHTIDASSSTGHKSATANATENMGSEVS